jgi:hypothetical protein
MESGECMEETQLKVFFIVWNVLDICESGQKKKNEETKKKKNRPAAIE